MLAMRPAGLAEWKITLADLDIKKGTSLWSKVNEDREQPDHLISKPTAKDAFDGETSQETWEVIFKELDLKWSNYFSEAEWNGWSLETRWGMLLNLAEDASDRFGLVFTQEPEQGGCGDLFEEGKFQRSIPSGKSVLLEIPAGLSGDLILLEQDPKGEICLVAPSCLAVDSALTGKSRLLPQYPPSPFKVLKPRTLGINYLWAGIFAELPDWEWLQVLEGGLVKLAAEQVTQLAEYAKAQPRETTHIWKSSYTVTAA
jgi:hypothetical protein